MAAAAAGLLLWNLWLTAEVNRLGKENHDHIISDPDEMYAIGYEEYFFGDGVCLVEWSGLIEELIPEDAVRIVISRDLERGTDYRRIEMTT